jgi:hypothetical protein
MPLLIHIVPSSQLILSKIFIYKEPNEEDFCTEKQRKFLFSLSRRYAKVFYYGLDFTVLRENCC